MNKSEFKKLFTKVITEQFDIDAKTGKYLGENIFQIIISALEDSLISGKGFAMREFGSMIVKETASVKRYNPYKNQYYFTDPKKTVKFKCSKKFRERMGKIND